MSSITVRGYEWSEAIGHFIKTGEPSDWLVGFIARRTSLPIGNTHVYLATVSLWDSFKLQDLHLEDPTKLQVNEVVLTEGPYEMAVQLMTFLLPHNKPIYTKRSVQRRNNKRIHQKRERDFCIKRT